MALLIKVARPFSNPEIFWILGSKLFLGPKSRIRELSYLRNPYLHRFQKVQKSSLKKVGGVVILVIDTCPKWNFEIWPFLWFLEDEMVNLGPIYFQIDLPLKSLAKQM